MVVIVRLVAHEAFALGKPRNAECAERQRFAPEEEMAGMTALDGCQHSETDHRDHAGNHDEAAGHIDSISVLLAAGESFLRRGLAKQKNADVSKREIHERGECGMHQAEYKLHLCEPGAAWIERGKACHADGADCGQVT